MSADAPIHEESCLPFRDWIGAGEHSELSAQERESFENHLVACAGCRQYYQETESAWNLLGKAPLPDAPSSDTEFLGLIQERIRRRSARRLVATLAAAAVLVAGFGLFWFFPEDEDSAIIENMVVLQELQAELSSAEGGDLSVTEMGREILSLLQEEPLTEEENWIEILNALLDESGERG